MAILSSNTDFLVNLITNNGLNYSVFISLIFFALRYCFILTKTLLKCPIVIDLGDLNLISNVVATLKSLALKTFSSDKNLFILKIGHCMEHACLFFKLVINACMENSINIFHQLQRISCISKNTFAPIIRNFVRKCLTTNFSST